MLIENMKGILITTSRRPSPRTRSFIKDLVGILPNSLKVNRGHLTMEELAILALSKGCDRLVIVGENRGNPSLLRVYKLERGGIFKNIVSIKVRGLALSREIKRSLPDFQPKELYVKANYDELMDFAEALMLGFHGRIYHKGIKLNNESLLAVLTLTKNGDVILEFLDYKNRYVGPKLKLMRVSKMIKNE